MKIFCRSGYNYDRDEASMEAGLDCGAGFDLATGECVLIPSKTKQSFAEECDINTIVRRFGLTGELPANVRMPSYGDFEDTPDYHTAMNAVRAAQESFMAMPADVRYRFNNDPGRFVDFCSDPANEAEARKLGLVEGPELPVVPVAVPLAVAPAPAPVVDIPKGQPEPGKAATGL